MIYCIDKSFARYFIIIYKNIENIFVYLLLIIFINKILFNFGDKHIFFSVFAKNSYGFKKLKYMFIALFLEIRIKIIIECSEFIYTLDNKKKTSLIQSSVIRIA